MDGSERRQFSKCIAQRGFRSTRFRSWLAGCPIELSLVLYTKHLALKQAIPDRLFCVVFRFSRRAAANGASDSLEVHRVENSASRRLQQRSCGEAGRPVEAQRLRHQMPPNIRGRERVVGRCVYKFNTSTIRQKIGCESFHASRRYTVRRPVVRI